MRNACCRRASAAKACDNARGKRIRTRRAPADSPWRNNGRMSGPPRHCRCLRHSSPSLCTRHAPHTAPCPAAAQARKSRICKKPLRGEAAHSHTTGAKRTRGGPEARRMHAASYFEAFPTFLRWHYPDQVRRDQGGSALSQPARAPLVDSLLTIREFPATVNRSLLTVTPGRACRPALPPRPYHPFPPRSAAFTPVRTVPSTFRRSAPT
jgi:hypothetical protein